MKKIIKIAAMVLIGLMLISKAIDAYEEIQRKERMEESYRNSDRTKSIGYQMVKNAMESGTEQIEPGDDVEPVFDQPYRSNDGKEWIFWRKGQTGINGMQNNDDIPLRLEKKATGVYDVCTTQNADSYLNVGIGCTIRMINGGQAIEVTWERKGTTIFTLAE
jgi:hypothetical protein